MKVAFIFIFIPSLVSMWHPSRVLNFCGVGVGGGHALENDQIDIRRAKREGGRDGPHQAFLLCIADEGGCAFSHLSLLVMFRKYKRPLFSCSES